MYIREQLEFFTKDTEKLLMTIAFLSLGRKGDSITVYFLSIV